MIVASPLKEHLYCSGLLPVTIPNLCWETFLEGVPVLSVLHALSRLIFPWYGVGMDAIPFYR